MDERKEDVVGTPPPDARHALDARLAGIRSVTLTPDRVHRVPPPEPRIQRAWFARPGPWLLVVAGIAVVGVIAFLLAHR